MNLATSSAADDMQRLISCQHLQDLSIIFVFQLEIDSATNWKLEKNTTK